MNLYLDITSTGARYPNKRDSPPQKPATAPPGTGERMNGQGTINTFGKSPETVHSFLDHTRDQR